jgi:hypothetical protein
MPTLVQTKQNSNPQRLPGPHRALFRHQFHFGVRLRRRLTMCALRGDQQRAQCRERGDAYMTVEKHIALTGGSFPHYTAVSGAMIMVEI